MEPPAFKEERRLSKDAHHGLNLDIASWLFVFLRVTAVVSVFPVFSAKNFPVRIRVALGALVAFLITPTLPAFPLEGYHFWGIVGVMVREVVTGLIIGFVSRMVFLMLDMAGNMIATNVGLNLASDVNPFSGVRTEVPGMILFYLGAMLFLNLDLHHHVLIALEKGYTILPIGEGKMSEAVMGDLLTRTSQIFAVALQMTAPMMAVAFVVMLVFALLGRAVSQINSFFESFAFRVLSGLAVLGLTMNLMSRHIINYLQRLPGDILDICQLLAR